MATISVNPRYTSRANDNEEEGMASWECSHSKVSDWRKAKRKYLLTRRLQKLIRDIVEPETGHPLEEEEVPLHCGSDLNKEIERLVETTKVSMERMVVTKTLKKAIRVTLCKSLRMIFVQ